VKISHGQVKTLFHCWAAFGTDGLIAASQVPVMPNPLHELTGDEDLYIVMVPLWCDDVSGNKLKQYNKHINMYMVNSNLPGQLLQQEYFVCFVSTSPNATSPEQSSALKDQIKYLFTLLYMTQRIDHVVSVLLIQTPFIVTMLLLDRAVMLSSGYQAFLLTIHSNLKNLLTWEGMLIMGVASVQLVGLMNILNWMRDTMPFIL
jgi:hypothetical protein